jgi:hypothetical protein
VAKRLSQIGVYQKNLARAPAPAIRDACLSRLAMLYKQLAQTFAGDRRYVIAAAYARMALAHRYSVKWQLYCLYLGLLATIRDCIMHNHTVALLPRLSWRHGARGGL